MRRLILALVLIAGVGLVLPPLFFRMLPRPAPELPRPGRMVALADGVSVNTLHFGAGPPVVLIHAQPGCAYDWGTLIEPLGDRGLHVIAYDRVGYGHSDPRPDDDFSVDANTRNLLRLLEAEDLRDVTLVGWSYGGAIAIRAALSDPSRIGRLVLVGSAGPEESPQSPPVLHSVLFSAPVMWWMAAVPPVGVRVQRMFSREAFSGQEQPGWWPAQLRANMAIAKTRRSYRREAAQFSADGLDPSGIDRPILVIHGEDDRLVPHAVGRWLAEHAKQGTLMTVPEGSHMLPITHTALLADRIAMFIRRR